MDAGRVIPRARHSLGLRTVPQLRKLAERLAETAEVAPLTASRHPPPGPILIDLRRWAGESSPEQRKDSDASNRVPTGNELSGDDLPTIPRRGVEFIGRIVHADLHHLELGCGHRASRRRGWLTISTILELARGETGRREGRPVGMVGRIPC